jgi:dipeptidyl aminopeptidase/acylaminoacyl peptidase
MWLRPVRWRTADVRPIWLTLLLVLSLLPPAARAEIVLVTPDSQAPVELPPDERARLAALHSARRVSLVSTVSPDGTTVLFGTQNHVADGELALYYLNVDSGELQQGPGPVLPSGDRLPIGRSPMVWRDDDTLQFGITSAANRPEVVRLNRAADIATRLTLDLDGEVLGFAPDFSRMVLVRVLEPPAPNRRNSDLGERQVFVLDLTTLERLEIDRVQPGFDIQPPSWSHDGTRMAFVTGTTASEGLGRTPLSPSLANPLVQDALGNLPPARNPLLQANELRVYDFRQLDPLRLTLAARDGTGDSIGAVAMSPDGERLLVRMQRPTRLTGRLEPIYTYPDRAYFRVISLDGSLETTIDRPELEAPSRSIGRWATNETLLFIAPLGTNRGLYRYELPTERLAALPLPPGSVGATDWTVTPDGRTVVYTFSSVQQRPEVFRIALDGSSAPVVLTEVNAALAEADRVRADEVRFTLTDGQERAGLLVQPADAAFPPRGVPILLWQRGGPGGVMVNQWMASVEDPFNLLPNFGLAVLIVPLAGREGYGPESYRRLAEGENFGWVDLADGAAIVEQLIARGYAAREQIGVTGCSYGGYYASQLIALYPAVVAAANPQCALQDTFVEWQLGYMTFLSYLVGRTPLESVERHRQVSPMYLAGVIRTPTLLFHGSKDFLQVDVTRSFHDVLMLNAVPVMLYEFTEAGHGLQSQADEWIAAQLQIDFFRRYLRR